MQPPPTAAIIMKMMGWSSSERSEMEPVTLSTSGLILPVGMSQPAAISGSMGTSLASESEQICYEQLQLNRLPQAETYIHLGRKGGVQTHLLRAPFEVGKETAPTNSANANTDSGFFRAKSARVMPCGRSDSSYFWPSVYFA